MSDTKPTQPRLMLPDSGHYQLSRLPDLIRDVYSLILATLHANPEMNAEEALKKVVRVLHDDRPHDYLLLLSCWSQDDDEPPTIWTAPHSEVDVRFDSDHRLWHKQTEDRSLLPFEKIDFNSVELGGGTGFYVFFESRDGISRDEYGQLLDALDERDMELGLLPIDAEKSGMVEGEQRGLVKAKNRPRQHGS